MSEPEPRARRPEFQFTDLAQQGETAELGMWVFLATEVLFFGTMIATYLAYRVRYPVEFAEAARESVLWIGTLNTVILATSGLTMVLAIRSVGGNDIRLATRLLLVTAALGAAFLGLKALEYYLDFRDHVVPALDFRLQGVPAGPAQLFWLFYFYATGLHAIHLIIGIVLLLVMAQWTARREFTPAYYAPLEVTGLYWAFVDIVWVFLFALIYPLGRALS